MFVVAREGANHKAVRGSGPSSTNHTVVCENLGCMILPEAGAGVHTLRSSQHSNAVIQLTTIF